MATRARSSCGPAIGSCTFARPTAEVLRFCLTAGGSSSKRGRLGMLVDSIRHAPPVIRATLAWIVFAAGIGVQAAAVRLATHRPKPVGLDPAEEVDIVASEVPAGACE